MQSQWHNCPTINGVMQKDGRQFAASDVQFKSGDKIKTLSMNIAHAYPVEASVKQYWRSFNFNGAAKELQLQDEYELSEWKSATQLNFITCGIIQINKEGEAILKTKEGNDVMKIFYNPKQLTLHSENKQMDDARLKKIWGDSIQRIVFTVNGKEVKENIIIKFIQL
jgi:hypothetical protein